MVLDFFAGSGTTGHAVMKLNAEDGGKRKFILVTNNENGICEKVTYERLRRVMEKEGYDASLKYFRIGFVPIGEEGYWDMADALLGHIRELVELENGIDFDCCVGVSAGAANLSSYLAGQVGRNFAFYTSYSFRPELCSLKSSSLSLFS